mmetsp:Transcript_21833/g.41128  ORF Transcript_21833/g.41128 Transcript_21833/m.41128 type:complete len:322 (+) Transcript_21833:310-1275(+)
MVLVGDRLLRMRGQARIHHLRHLGVLLQELGNCHRVLRLLPHAQMHGLAGLQNDISSEGVDDVAVDVLDPLHLLVHGLVLADHGTSCHHVVAFIVLCQALDHHVRPPVKRATHDGRGKGGVDYMLGASLVGNLRDRLKISERQNWVGGGLAEHELRVRLHGLLHVLRIAEVDERELHIQGREELSARPIGASVRAVGDDTVVACLHRGGDGAGGRSHASAEGAGPIPVLHRGELLFQRRDGRVVRARVAVALVQVLLHGLLDESRGEEKRRQDRTTFRLWCHGCVHHVRVQLHLSLEPGPALRGLAPHGRCQSLGAEAMHG